MEYPCCPGDRLTCQRKCEHLFKKKKKHLQELADVDAEGDNVLATADLRPSGREKKGCCSPAGDGGDR